MCEGFWGWSTNSASLLLTQPKLQPIREFLVKENAWVWGEYQKTIFTKVKTALTASPVLTLFDPNQDTVISADASSFGLGAVLKQRQKTGELKPVAMISRSMTPTERRYAQIEKEALAFTWACERLSDYLTGLHFHIETDHKSVVSLFSTNNLEVHNYVTTTYCQASLDFEESKGLSSAIFRLVTLCKLLYKTKLRKNTGTKKYHLALETLCLLDGFCVQRLDCA